MPIASPAWEKIKSSLLHRREEMLKLLDLERHWPVRGETGQPARLKKLIREKEAIICRLEKLAEGFELPARDLVPWLAQFPPAERAEIAASLEMLRELTILALDWHQQHAGPLSLQAEELAEILKGANQEKAVMHALRETPWHPLGLNLAR
jgi:hypothetical protein